MKINQKIIIRIQDSIQIKLGSNYMVLITGKDFSEYLKINASK